jgi:hypothetical protein
MIDRQRLQIGLAAAARQREQFGHVAVDERGQPGELLGRVIGSGLRPASCAPIDVHAVAVEPPA